MDAETKVELDRLHDEDKRLGARVSKLEEQIESVNGIALSVQKLAINMESMLKELEKQGSRLDKIEDAPIEAWSSTKKAVFNGVIGAICSTVTIALLYVIATQIVK